MKNIIERLLELEFELDEKYNRGKVYIFTTSRNIKNKDRFTYDFIYSPDENQFYINAYKSSYRTISEEELLRNNNNLNTFAKNKWLEIKKELEGFEFDICLA